MKLKLLLAVSILGLSRQSYSMEYPMSKKVLEGIVLTGIGAGVLTIADPENDSMVEKVGDVLRSAGLGALLVMNIDNAIRAGYKCDTNNKHLNKLGEEIFGSAFFNLWNFFHTYVVSPSWGGNRENNKGKRTYRSTILGATLALIYCELRN